MADLDRRTLLTGALTLTAAAAAGGWAWLLRGQDPDGAPVVSSSTSPSPSDTPSSSPSLTDTPAPSVAPSSSTAPSIGPSPSAEPSPQPEPSPSSEPPVAQTSPGPTTGPSPTTAPTVVSVLCRDAWGARPPTGAYREHAPDQITVHHTAVVLADNTDAPARLRQHQRYHQDAGWADIAYHLGVDRNGHVYELRPVSAPGDTFTEYDPVGHVLIVAEGHFDQQQPTDAQVAKVADLVAWACGRFGIGLDRVDGHREHASTTCPGDAMFARMEELRQRAAQLLAGGGVELDLVCGEQGRRQVAAIEAGQA